MKECTVCKKTKDLDEFHKNRSTKDKRNSRCKECNNAGSAEQYARGYQSEHYFGLTKQQRHELYERTNYVCEMCEQPERYKGRVLSIDHDRNCCDSRKSCGTCVRGVLCANCNMILGRHERKGNVSNERILNSIDNYLNKPFKQVSLDDFLESTLPIDLFMRT